MISAKDLYNVLTAVVPLYVAMVLAYGSVKWWKIFSPDQCSGINRFVALFAVPLLSFHFIAMNDPYSMNYRFIAADTLQKLAVLTALLLWCKLAPGSSIEWSNTFFSIATLPNTLVMGIPLLRGMYDTSSGTLMVQIVVLQCIIWYTLLLFLFEYRGARLLIGEQFPDNAASIVSLRIDSDVVSLDGREPLETHTEIGDDGRLKVIVRKSTSSRSEIFSRHSHGHSFTPRPSNMTNTEIYSLQSSRNPTPRGSNFNYGDFASMAFSAKNTTAVDEEKGIYSRFHRPNGTLSPPAPGKKTGAVDSGKETHMFVWSSSASPVSEKGVFRGGEQQSKEYTEQQQQREEEEEEFSFPKRAENMEGSKMRSSSTVVLRQAEDTSPAPTKTKSMPPASVMSRLILIMVWRKLIRNPNTYSSLLGLAWSLFSFKLKVEMPAIVARSIAILSDTGLGMAMFSLGLFMALQPKMIACGNKVAFFAMGVRFLVGPAVMAASSLVVGLRGVLLHIAIVQAALPQGIVPFVFSKEYGVHPEVLSTGVIFGMLIALPITLVYYILLEI